MNSRERTFLALEHKVGDRIPIDVWATPSVVQALEVDLGKPYEAILDDFGVDLRYIEGPRYIGPSLAEGTDIWGVVRGTVSTGSSEQSECYNEVTRAPLSDARTAEDVEAYRHWPDPDMFDYDVIEEACR